MLTFYCIIVYFHFIIIQLHPDFMERTEVENNEKKNLFIDLSLCVYNHENT